MRTRREPPVQIKSPAQLELMRVAGLVVARALRAVVSAVEPGVSTADLDAIAEGEIRAAGAVPSFKGYHGFPATICASVNDEIVHGIPSPDRRLAAGDPDAARLVGLPLDRFHNVPLGPINAATKDIIAPLVERAAFVISFNEAWILLGVLFGLSLLAVPFVPSGKTPKPATMRR